MSIDITLLNFRNPLLPGAFSGSGVTLLFVVASAGHMLTTAVGFADIGWQSYELAKDWKDPKTTLNISVRRIRGRHCSWFSPSSLSYLMATLRDILGGPKHAYVLVERTK